MIKNGFVIEPYYELLPDYKICPFGNKDLLLNRTYPNSDLCDEYFKQRFCNNKFYYTNNGRQAISLALSYYNLNYNDCVTIFTTSGNFYISSCVTREIEKLCQWSRKIEDNTKVILVNHEFGYPYQDLDLLRSYNLPIIEDCAHSFLSIDTKELIGKTGDFVIYSFPKIFPVQFGGLLIANINCTIDFEIERNIERYLKNVVSEYIPKIEEIKQIRQDNYHYINQLFKQIGFTERFETSKNVIPGVYIFKTNTNINLAELKKYMYQHGIQCSVFYGEDSFFLPVHQSLQKIDFLYFYEVVNSFIKQS